MNHAEPGLKRRGKLSFWIYIDTRITEICFYEESSCVSGLANVEEVFAFESGLGDCANIFVLGIWGSLDLNNLVNLLVGFITVASYFPTDDLSVGACLVQVLDSGLAIASGGGFSNNRISDCLDGISKEFIPLRLIIIKCNWILLVTHVHSDCEGGKDQRGGS